MKKSHKTTKKTTQKRDAYNKNYKKYLFKHCINSSNFIHLYKQSLYLWRQLLKNGEIV